MIKSIHIQNFKSLKDILMIPTSLNLLMGLNGMGKSSLFKACCCFGKIRSLDWLSLHLMVR